MGRGRAKAKQTKVARELKYRSVSTDFSSLERELRGTDDMPEPGIPDAYADIAAQYEAYSDEGDDDEGDALQMRRSG